MTYFEFMIFLSIQESSKLIFESVLDRFESGLGPKDGAVLSGVCSIFCHLKINHA